MGSMHMCLHQPQVSQRRPVMAGIFLQCNTKINLPNHNKVNQSAVIKSISTIQEKKYIKQIKGYILFISIIFLRQGGGRAWVGGTNPLPLPQDKTILGIYILCWIIFTPNHILTFKNFFKEYYFHTQTGHKNTLFSHV